MNMISKLSIIVLCMCFACTLIVPVTLANNVELIYLPAAEVGEQYNGYLAQYNLGLTDSYELTGGKLPNGTKIIYDTNWGDNTTGNWIITGIPRTSGLFCFDIKFYSSTSSEEVIIKYSVQVYDVLFNNATVCELFSEAFINVTDGYPQAELCDGALPSGTRIISDGGALNLVGAPTEMGSFVFVLTLTYPERSDELSCRITVNDREHPAQNACVLYDCFDENSGGWELTNGWELASDNFAYQGSGCIKTKTVAAAISKTFKLRTGSIISWYDIGEVGDSYDLLISYTNSNDIDEYEKIGTYTATGIWSAHVEYIDIPSDAARIAFAHKGSTELRLDLITVTKGYDNTRTLIGVYSGYEFDIELERLSEAMDVFAVYNGITGTSVTTTIVDETLIYRLAGSVEAGNYRFDIEYGQENGEGTVIIRYLLEVYDIMLGDVNCDRVVNTGDAVQILRHAVGLVEFSTPQGDAADMNQDNLVNTGDAVTILKFCVGM